MQELKRFDVCDGVIQTRSNACNTRVTRQITDEMSQLFLSVTLNAEQFKHFSTCVSDVSPEKKRQESHK